MNIPKKEKALKQWFPGVTITLGVTDRPSFEMWFGMGHGWIQTSPNNPLLLFPLSLQTPYDVIRSPQILWAANETVKWDILYIPEPSCGQSSQGSPHPSPFIMQQHSCLEWFLDLGTIHWPFSNLVKQKLTLRSKQIKNGLYQAYTEFISSHPKRSCRLLKNSISGTLSFKQYTDLRGLERAPIDFTLKSSLPMLQQRKIAFNAKRFLLIECLLLAGRFAPT